MFQPGKIEMMEQTMRERVLYKFIHGINAFLSLGGGPKLVQRSSSRCNAGMDRADARRKVRPKRYRGRLMVAFVFVAL